MDEHVRLHESLKKFTCKKADRHTASHAKVEKTVDEEDSVEK
jgi:hypothetical protein